MNYRVGMIVIFVIVLGFFPALLSAAGTAAGDQKVLIDGPSFLVADSSSENGNITIVLPPKDGEGDETAEDSSWEKQDRYTGWKKGFELESNFNTKDWMLGFGLGMQHSYGFSLLLRFQVRPLTNSVFVEKLPGVYRQYNERRMVLGLSAGWDYIIAGPVGFYLTAGYGISFAYFRGSDENPETKWTPMPGGGLLLKPWETTSLRCGYEYIRTPEYPDHHISISAVFMF